MLAPEIPADVHQLDRVERAAAPPRRARGVRALAFETVEHRDETGAEPRSPQDTPMSSPTWTNMATSTSLKRPARMKYAFVPTSSSAVPDQMRIVPGSFSRCMIFFTASAAVMFSGSPELCPSPCPGRLR